MQVLEGCITHIELQKKRKKGVKFDLPLLEWEEGARCNVNAKWQGCKTTKCGDSGLVRTHKNETLTHWGGGALRLVAIVFLFHFRSKYGCGPEEWGSWLEKQMKLSHWGLTGTEHGLTPGHKKTELQWWKNRAMSLENTEESEALTSWCSTVRGGKDLLAGSEKSGH